jgi:hypothetical protein
MSLRFVCRGGPAKYDGYAGVMSEDRADSRVIFDDPHAVYVITDEIEQLHDGPALVARFIETI